MPTLADLTRLADEVIDRAAAAYDPDRVPDAFAAMPAAMLTWAWGASGGNWRRCVTDPDGSLTVLNHPAW